MMKNLRSRDNQFNNPKIRARRRGVAMVEMAFVVTILLTLTLGLIQWGLIMNASISLTNLSREGARFAAVQWDNKPDPDTKIINYVKNDAPPGIKKDDLNVVVSPDSASRVSGQPITVTVTYDMSKKLFLPQQIFYATFFSDTYKAEGRMMME